MSAFSMVAHVTGLKLCSINTTPRYCVVHHVLQRTAIVLRHRAWGDAQRRSDVLLFPALLVQFPGT